MPTKTVPLAAFSRNPAESATYTLLVTLTGRQPADETALAQRIKQDLENGTAAGAPYAAAEVDVVAGDWIAAPAGSDAQRAKLLHANLRA